MSPKLVRANKRQQIKERITTWIREEGLAPGDRIMSQADLAREFRTTEVTIHRALTELADEGIVHRLKARGTFVGPARAPLSNRLCLVLPGENLDDPSHNPEAWPYVQTLLREFLSFAGSEWTFITRGVKGGPYAPNLLKELRTCAAVFFLHTKEPRGLLRQLIKQRATPVVAFGQPDSEIACLTVDHDRVSGARRGVSYLIARGYRRIGFIGTKEIWGHMSFEGYQAALAEAGIAVEPKRVIRGCGSHAYGARGAAALLKRAPDCDAVFIESDLPALAACEVFAREGRRIPGDLAVMGYDGVDLATAQPPFLTTVAMPRRAMIGAALEEVIRSGVRPSPVKHMSLVGDVVEGKTVARA